MRPSRIDGPRWSRLAGYASYIGLIAVLAGLGAVHQDARYYLAALVLSLPCGLAAVVGSYLGYALLKGVGGLVLSSTVADGSDAGWLSLGSATVNVVLFTAAAAGNVLLLRAAVAARAAHRQLKV